MARQEGLEPNSFRFKAYVLPTQQCSFSGGARTLAVLEVITALAVLA